jgi:deferrochelatase/peroxidase EfeB
VNIGALPADAHVALAHPDANGGVRILRRGYSYVDGSDGFGHLDAGLFFIAFCRDPARSTSRCRPASPAPTRWPSTSRTPPRVCTRCRPGSGPGEYWAQFTARLNDPPIRA